MSRRRTRRVEEHASHERWLVSYADFITLLFAFFVVLYASAQVDMHKIAQVAASIKVAFNQGVFTGAPSPVPTEAVFSATGAAAARQLAATASSEAPPPSAAGVDTEDLQKRLEDALGDEVRNKRVKVRVTPEGLVISLREIGFFNSGDAELLPESKPTLARIAQILNQQGFDIRVEGHTDNVPIHTARFPSNWELSSARATAIVTMLVDNYGFDPHTIYSAACAEYRPVASNDTEEGRKSNRRIDLVVVGSRPPVPPSPDNSRS